VQVEGEIDRDGRASAENVIEGLHAAFEHPGTKGVVLLINSPGGSPVQAGQIYNEVRRLRAKHPTIPLHAVVEDMAASGGYYIAAAADRIYVDPASLVGSIGVIIDGFGFVGTIEKLGVERRVLTAGENKAFLDPFQPIHGAAPGCVDHRQIGKQLARPPRQRGAVDAASQIDVGEQDVDRASARQPA